MQNKYFIKFSAYFCIAVCLFGLTACKKNETETDSLPSNTESANTSSVLLPVEATFDEKYTKMFPKGDGDAINVKGNCAMNVLPRSAKMYDPTSFEALNLDTTYTFADGLGVGSTCAEFMEHFGIGRGYYVAVDSDGNAVDISKKQDKKFTFTAILKFDEAQRKMSYFSANMISSNAEGLLSAGTRYLMGVDIGKDLLVVTLSVKGDLTVEEFDIIHYII